MSVRACVIYRARVRVFVLCVGDWKKKTVWCCRVDKKKRLKTLNYFYVSEKPLLSQKKKKDDTLKEREERRRNERGRSAARDISAFEVFFLSCEARRVYTNNNNNTSAFSIVVVVVVHAHRERKSFPKLFFRGKKETAAAGD